MQGEPSEKSGISESTVSSVSRELSRQGDVLFTQSSLCSNVQRKGLVKVLLSLLERVQAWGFDP